MEHICSRDIRENPKPQDPAAFSRPYHFMMGKKLMDALKGKYKDHNIPIKALQELETAFKNPIRLQEMLLEPGLLVQIIHLISTSDRSDIVSLCYRVLDAGTANYPSFLQEFGCLEPFVNSVLELETTRLSCDDFYHIFSILDTCYGALLPMDASAVLLSSPKGLKLIEKAVEWLGELQRQPYTTQACVVILAFLCRGFETQPILMAALEKEFGQQAGPSAITCLVSSFKRHEQEALAGLTLAQTMALHTVFLDALEQRTDVFNALLFADLLHHPNAEIVIASLHLLRTITRHVGCCYVLFKVPEDRKPLVDALNGLARHDDVRIRVKAAEVIASFNETQSLCFVTNELVAQRDDEDDK